MSKPLVLVADDDPLLRAILEHKLSTAGYAVDLVEDGRAALEAALAQQGLEAVCAGTGKAALELLDTNPDVVLLDIDLPDCDGFGLCRRQFAGREIIQKEQWARATTNQIVDAHRHQIAPDRIVLVEFKSDFEFGAHAIGRRNQQRLGILRKIMLK